MDSTIVIKAKYGDTLRRFNARVNENAKLDLDMGELRAKILGLFNFPPDTDMTLTYVDEDGDTVALVDDDDLLDVMRQRLKFLRIDVQLNNDKSDQSYARSSGSSTPNRSPRVRNPLPCISSGIAEVMKSVPEPLREMLVKLSVDLASTASQKAASSNLMLAELVDCFSKMGQPCPNPASQSPVSADSSTQTGFLEAPMASSVPTVPKASKDSGMKEVLPKAKSTSKTTQEGNVENVTRGVGVPATPFPAPVDLNLNPLYGSKPGNTTENFAPAISYRPAGNEEKETKKLNPGHLRVQPFCFGPSASSINPMKNLGNECPFGGMLAPNDCEPPIVFQPHKRFSSRHDAMVGFHKGVQCDSCGAHPIIGPRYKSKVKDDYDLCNVCFAALGNETDYIRMDRPISYWHSRSFKGLHNPSCRVGPPPAFPHLLRTCSAKPARSNKLDSRFIMDVSVLDGTLMAPSTPFTKIWRMRNSGSVVWPQGARLVWIGGDRFSCADSAEIEIPVDGIPVDGEIDVAVDFTAPELPGRYISYWRLASPSGTKFGQRVWVLIQVDAALKDSLCDSFQGFNLNLPPESSGSKYPEIIDMNVQPVAGGDFPEPCNFSPISEPVNPMVDGQPKDLNYPPNGTFLAEQVFSAPTAWQTPSTVSYPMIDLSETTAAGPSHALFGISAPALPEDTGADDAVENNLLKELEEMGFKQVDLNKEILKMNKYNLEQSVDDLCGVAEWDPILGELQEMGFCDEETNRKLLKKNNGSIKGVVMDLLTGEKA